MIENIPLESYFIPSVNKGMTTGHKVMIVLHGRGDSLHSYKTFTKEINVTGLNYLLLNAPFTEMFGYSWYDDSFDFNDRKYLKSLELLQESLNKVVSYGFLPEDIFLFGFSQGGRMVLDLLKKQSHKYAGVVALSPRVSLHQELPKNSEVNQTPLFIAHGEYDDIIPLKETIQNLEIWKKSFPSFNFESYQMGHEVDIMEILSLRKWLNEHI